MERYACARSSVSSPSVFSLVSELANTLECRAAPIFPSLIEEGQPGGGYDVVMDLAAVPFFLQFKLSEHLKPKALTPAMPKPRCRRCG